MYLENNLLSWSVIITMISLLIYTAIVVSREGNLYKKYARKVLFHHFIFLLPPWWVETQGGEGGLRFERDRWFAEFKILPYKVHHLETMLQGIVREKELVFDGDTKIISKPKLKGVSEQLEVLRVEGMATKGGERRVYCDIFLIKDRKNRQFLLGESCCPVLEGMIEGPYFEKVLMNLRYA